MKILARWITIPRLKHLALTLGFVIFTFLAEQKLHAQSGTLHITTSSLSPGVVGTSFSFTMSAAGGKTPYTWSLASGTLPAGLTLSGAGAISGTPTTAGTSNFTVRVADSGSQTASTSLSLTINPGPLSITTASPLPAGITGASYSQTLVASGGSTPYTWSVASGTLPAGLTLSGAGVMSGTPTTAGTSNFTVRVADSASQTASKPLSLTITPGPLSITTASPLPDGITGASYSQTLVASGGTTPYTWSVASGTLPAGLALSGGGVISGTPTSAATFDATVKITDSSKPAQTATKILEIKIAAVLTISATSLPSGVVGRGYQQTLGATGGSAPYSWSLVSGSLPAGITLNSAGVLSGTPLIAGIFTFVVRVTDAMAPPQAATQTFAILFTNPLSIISQSNLNNGSVGVAYSVALSASGGTPSYSWSLLTGQLPLGLTLSLNGILSGTPTTPGSLIFTIQVSDNIGAVSSQSFMITIQTGLTITTASPLPKAVVDSPYSQQIQGSIPGALTWSVISGNLPPGTTMSSSGLISGAPTSIGVFNFTVQVIGGTPQQIAVQPFRLEVISALAITSASILPDGTLSVLYTGILSAIGGVAPYTWTRTSGSLPDGLNLSASGLIGGTPSRTGVFTFTVQVSDNSILKTDRVFTISVVASPIGSLSLVNVPDMMNPAQQVPIGLSLSAPQPNPVSGSLTMTFTSNSVVPRADPAVQFSSGARIVNFTIPANGTAAVFPTTVWLLTGTVSGTVVLTADIQGGPAGVPVGSITIAPTVPQMTNIVAQRTSDGLKIQVTGYSPDCKVISAGFDFDVKLPNGTQPVSLLRNVESDFDGWYGSAVSSAFGSSFVFEQVFVVQGDSSMIESVIVSLTNGQGIASSTAVPINLISP